MEFYNYKKKLETKVHLIDKNMNTLINLEKKINSELTTKIDSSKILHNQLYININKDVHIFGSTTKLHTQEKNFKHLYYIRDQ